MMEGESRDGVRWRFYRVRHVYLRMHVSCLGRTVNTKKFGKRGATRTALRPIVRQLSVIMLIISIIFEGHRLVLLLYNTIARE